ncbi:hypothetical protein LAZ67_22001131, partial [Cordylochernes scorpioides]
MAASDMRNRRNVQLLLKKYKHCSSCIPGLRALTGYYQRGQLNPGMPSHRRSNLSQRSNSSRVQHAYRLRETRGQNIRRLRAQSARQAAVRSLETPDPIHSRLQAHSEIYSSTRRNTRTNNFFSSVWSSMENAGFNYSVAVEYFKHPLISLGIMDTTCRFCGALRWKDESSGMCCSNGKVRLPLIDLPPEPLRSLLSGENSDSVHFLRHIRKYNSCFQMTSFGAENQTHSVTFPTTFSIQGQVYHRIGSLMPSENQPSRFLQIYFMGNDDDDDIQTDRRCQQIQGVRRNIVQGLQRMLHQHNLLVQQFKTAHENLPSDAYRVVVNADRTPPGQHPRRYNAPTANEVAVVLAGNQFGSRDIVLHQRDNLLQHVSDTHRFYDALQYPLIFWKGQEGYSFHIPQIDPNTRQPLSSKVSSMDFYGYFIMVRRNSPNVIVQFGQLFHQFLVDMYAKVESERLRYITLHQRNLRAESYIHLRDALSTDANINPNSLGQRIILPSSFVNSPRRRAPEAGGFTAKVKILGREEVTIDNRWVVPYSPLLSKMFCAHINVENCSSVKAIKYICKYVNKGSDQAIINLRREGRGPDPQNEVRMYQCARYISSNEAVWRLLSFPLHQRHPAVIHLAVHLENGERIYFNQNTLAHRMRNPPRTTLTAFFSLCQTDSFARTLLYPDVPQYYTWNSSAHEWRRRVQGKLVEGQPGVKRSDTIGRVYAVHVSNFECFCLRMLLHNIKGPTSFAYLKIVNGSQYETFRETCAALGLSENDNHWVVTMDEAVLCQAPTRVRQLFAILISTCTISNPQQLWITYRDEMASDILHRYQLLDSSIRYNDLIYNETLCNIEDRVVSICGKKLQELGLGAPRRNVVTNSDILRELAYDTAELEDNVASMLPKLLPEQRRVFDAVLAKINLSQPIIIFLDAPGGTGKTFLLNLLLAMIRKEQNIAIAVASSGIAATLLAGGRTAHSVLKLPLTFAEGQTAVCNIRINSDKASLLRSCKLLVWDECTMAHKIALEALDRTLQDIRDDPQPMGGLVVLLVGDFRQTLPVVTRGTPADELNACLKSSYLWSHIVKMHLTVNMRVQLHNDTTAAQFADELLKIGEGQLETDSEGKLRLAYLENPKASWTQLVKRITQTYNNTPHSVTSFPPTYLMFNVVPTDLRTHLNPYSEITRAREIARSRTQNKHKKDKETFDKQHRTPHFEVNDLVLVKNYRHPDTGKLAPYFTGPYTVIGMISPNVVRIDRPNQPLNRDSDTIHVNKLKYYTENVLYIRPPQLRFVQNPQRLPQDVYLSEFNHLTPDIFEMQLFRIIPPTTSLPFLHLNPDFLKEDVESQLLTGDLHILNQTKENLHTLKLNLDSQVLKLAKYKSLDIADKFKITYNAVKEIDGMLVSIDRLLDGIKQDKSTSEEFSIKLPKFQLPIFSGNFSEWLGFKEIFIKVIDQNRALANSQKLQYLVSALRGDAARLVRAFSISDENYSIAWQTLIHSGFCIMPRRGRGRLALQSRRAYRTRRRNNAPNPISPVPTEYIIGGLDIVCPYCSALHFPGETVGSSCCHKGKVILPTLSSFPYEMMELMTSNSVEAKYFQTNIRSYNSSLAFASMGAQVDVFSGQGPFCYRIHGQIYHLTGPLHPHGNRARSYAQLYILDSEAANNTRIAASRPLECHPGILTLLDSVLRRVNPYTSAYRQMHQVELAEEHRARIENRQMCQVQMLIRQNHCRDLRRYNAPSVSEVAAIFVDQDGHVPSNRDIAVFPHDRGLVRISPLNPNCDPMTYPLLFPAGDPGWAIGILHEENMRTSTRNHVTMLQFYSYRLAIRPGFSPIHYGRRLFQQYVVDAYVKTEGNRLNYIRQNQSLLRVELYQGLMDYIHEQEHSRGVRIGRIFILPSSFPGSSRAMQQNYQDAMAIVRKFGIPDLFVTFTCNPRWTDIVENLLPNQNPSDRHDLVARVFNLKLQQLLREIVSQHVLGVVIARVHVVEFQKRGLPHAHMLFMLREEDKPRDRDAIDRLVCAEIPSPTMQVQLYDMVRKHMIQGPCGNFNLHSPCMSDGKCTKDFPKSFLQLTEANNNGYPRYRRRDDGQTLVVGTHEVDNRWVVPYNPYLLVRFNAHINVEVCASVKSVKYLFKYVNKGHDRAEVEVSVGELDMESRAHDEIKNFLDARYVSAPEAMWRMFEYRLHAHSHTICRLAVHLPNFQSVYFVEGSEEQALENASRRRTTLTAWFQLNCVNVSARSLLYGDIPSAYVFRQNQWSARVRGGALCIGRAQSFEDLRTVDDIVCSTFKEAAQRRGLLADDSEWDACLAEAALFQMPCQLRQLFATILIYNNPTDPVSLWTKYKGYLSEDFSRATSDAAAEQMTLRELEFQLRENRLSCHHYGLPAPLTPLLDSGEDHLDVNAELQIGTEMYRSLTPDQKSIVDTIVDSLNVNPRCFFIDGPGGTGKTYVYNTLIHCVRAVGKIVIPLASTGIAATLLSGGQTVHSRFKLPIPLLENSVAAISANSSEAELIRRSSLIIWDEAPMAHYRALEIVDRLLKDIMHCDLAFGGKVVVLGGDFRQVLLVVPRASRAEIVAACIKQSKLWPLFVILRLTQNMRAESCIFHGVDLVQEIFGSSYGDITALSQSVILTPKNTDSLEINEKVLDRLPNRSQCFLSVDSVECENVEEQNNYPTEFLNSLTPTGMPPHRLNLKIGAIVMLLRNLNPKQGLCNGTRMVIQRMRSHVLEAQILTGTKVGQTVLVPKISLAPSDTNLPFILKRRQFPLRSNHLVYACKLTAVCRVCKLRHYTLLHEFTSESHDSNSLPGAIHAVESSNANRVDSSVRSNVNSSARLNAVIQTPSINHSSSSSQILLSTALIRVNDLYGNYCMARALVDTGSQRTLITDSLRKTLNLPVNFSDASMYGIGDNCLEKPLGEVDITFSPHYSNMLFTAKALILNKIICNLPNFVMERSRWPHLVGLRLADPTFDKPASIDIIIGADIAPSLYTGQVRFQNERGPTACNSKLGWLLSDIEKMYRQILIHPDDSDYQRVLWRDSPSDAIQGYKLTTITYRTACAPYLAIRTLHQLADDEAMNYPVASEIVKRDFYVDDLLTGADTVEEAQVLIRQIIALLAEGGFPIRKWVSNSPKILDFLPKDQKGINQSFDFMNLPSVKLLGILWDPSLDSFTIRVKPPDIQ